jgi:hypothetical protein
MVSTERYESCVYLADYEKAKARTVQHRAHIKKEMFLCDIVPKWQHQNHHGLKQGSDINNDIFFLPGIFDIMMI